LTHRKELLPSVSGGARVSEMVDMAIVQLEMSATPISTSAFRENRSFFTFEVNNGIAP